jgi:nucleoside-triphosphatase THEP1
MSKTTIISGLIRTGKTTLLKEWVDRNPSVCGVLTPDIKSERTFVHYPDRTRYKMVCKPSAPDAIKIGKFHFHRGSFVKINELLIQDFDYGKCKWLVIDEIGPLELKNQGLHPSLQHIFERERESEKRIILIVRKGLVEEVVAHYSLKDYKVIPKELIEEIKY